MVTDTPKTISRTNSLGYWLAIIGVVLIAGGLWIGLNRVNTSETSAGLAQPVTGSPAPEIQLRTLDGETVSLSSYQGRPVLVNFWATWCGPCRVEMPEFQEAHREFGDDLVILGVNATSQDNGDIEGFVNGMGITFPILLDERGEALDAYQIFAMPTSVFIDRNGIIKEIYTGPINKAYIKSKLSEL